MASWRVNEAAAHFSEVIARACSEGPQIITHHGIEHVVVLSVSEYKALVAARADFKSWLLDGPKVDGFTIGRSGDTGRDVIP
jgi:prevent-host-death family protein